MAETENREKVLEVNNLRVSFKTDHGIVKAVRGVSFDLYKGETLCIVGESGSGKSVSSKAIMGILANNSIVENGTIMYEGENLLEVSEEEYVNIRGHKIGMIFQDPLSSLNPIMRIGKQITEATILNGNKIKKLYLNSFDKENIAYKNLITFKKVRTNKIKTKLAADIEALKHAEKIKATKDLSKLKQILDRDIYNVTDKTEFKIIDAKDILKEKLLEIKSNRNEELANAKNSGATQDEITIINNKYNELISSAKAEYANVVSEAKALKANQIADLKAKYSEGEAVIKTQGAKKHSQDEMAEINEKIAKLKEQAQKEIDAINLEFNSKMPEAKSNLAEAKAKARIIVKEYKQKVFESYAKDCEEALNKKNNALQSLETEFLSDEEKAKRLKEINNAYRNDKRNARSKKVDATRITRKEAKKRALEIMKEVGIPYPEKRFKQYPFEFSGGMRQRIVIAIALTASPDVLICDEPTTALDVTIQAQILELINKLKRERQLSVIFITHDLGVVANMADRVAVMYAGKIVEYGNVNEIFYEPKHPYTWALLSSIPDVDSKEKLEAIPGTPPNLVFPPKGDAFADRSKYAMEIDYKYEPPYFKVSDTHYAATWLLAPGAPKVEMPKIVSERIRKSLEGGNK